MHAEWAKRINGPDNGGSRIDSNRLHSIIIMRRLVTVYIHERSPVHSSSLQATHRHRPTRNKICSYQQETRPEHSNKLQSLLAQTRHWYMSIEQGKFSAEDVQIAYMAHFRQQYTSICPSASVSLTCREAPKRFAHCPVQGSVEVAWVNVTG